MAGHGRQKASREDFRTVISERAPAGVLVGFPRVILKKSVCQILARMSCKVSEKTNWIGTSWKEFIKDLWKETRLYSREVQPTQQNYFGCNDSVASELSRFLFTLYAARCNVTNFKTNPGRNSWRKPWSRSCKIERNCWKITLKKILQKALHRPRYPG